MATIHMEVEACQSVQNTMGQAKGDLEQRAREVLSQVDSMIGSTYIAPGAEQLKGEVDTWHGKMTQLLEELQELTNRLNREIVQFIETGGAI